MPADLVTGPTVTQNLPFLPWWWPQLSPALILVIHGGTVRLSWP